MIKRKIILGDYDTAANGWTLAECKLSKAEQKTKFVDKPGGDGSWDLSTVLTDGLMRYKDRTLTATLECSEGNRLSRKVKIDEMINALDGLRVNITLPDDDQHYITGLLSLEEKYNDLAHAAVEVKATCEPWKYATEETVVTLSATSTEKVETLRNNGRRAVVPTLTVEAADGASVSVRVGPLSQYMTQGVYKWVELILVPGDKAITYSGDGTLEIRYREAVL